MKTRYALFFCLLLGCAILKAQSQGLTPFRDIIPSPNSCALAQYADFPVSLYTGTPAIDIPIYTIDLGDYKFPINLSYHASGIRVAQEASWVGLGWVLNAGGAIMRTIRGHDDFEGYYYNEEESPEKTSDIEKSGYTGLTKDPVSKLDYCRLLFGCDVEPDIFYYNFADYSGHFYCKRGGDKLQAINPGSGFICAEPENNLKIEEIHLGSETAIAGLKITTPDGTAYGFVQPEMKYSQVIKDERASMHSYEGPFAQNDIFVNNNAYTTAWYLKDIYYPNGNRITFDYEEERNAYLSPVSVSQYLYNILAEEGEKHPAYLLDSKGIYSADLTVEYPRLKRITWENGYIEFVASEAKRKDIRSLDDYKHSWGTTQNDYARSLQEIRIYSSGKNNRLLKTYKFHTSYFSSDKFCEPYLRFRLRLDSITLKGASECCQMYKMEYDTLHALPAKYSFSCDYWGYYNGKANTCLYPSVVTDRDYLGLQGEIAMHKGTSLSGADRTANPTLVTSSMLTAFETPEGGRTEFTYEPNKIAGETVRIPLSSDGVYRGSVHFVKPAKEHLCTFVFNMPCDGYIDFEYRYHGNEFHAAEEKGTAMVAFGKYYFTIRDIDDRENFIMNKHKLHLFKGISTIDLQSNTTVVESEITIKFYEIPYYTGLPPSCGVRIAKVKSPLSTKRFQYVDSNNQSTGILLRDLLHTVRETYSFYNKEVSAGGNLFVKGGSVAVLKQSSMPVNPVESQTAGVLFGYSKVRVLTDTKDGDLIEDFYYYNRKEKEPVIPGYPGEFVFTNGKLKRHCIYRDGQLIKSSGFVYQETPLYELKALREDEGNFFLISSYKIPVKFCGLFQRRDSVIDNSAELPIVHTNLISYQYNPDNFQPRQITKVVTDRNRSETQELFYATDFKDRSPYREMCSKANMVCTPIEENFYKGAQNRLIKKTLHAYKENKQNIHGGHFVPDAEYTYYQPESLAEPTVRYGDFSLYKKPDIRYVGYDSLSNHTSIESRMGQSAVYVWGYHRRYVIAQIFNATLEEVKAQGVDIEKIGGTAEPTATQWQALHALRSKLPKADVSVMTYEPEVGITSKTDGRGMTTYYEYDDMGRLSCVRDNDYNIIQTNHLKLATEK